jgi:hypothetical protein
VLYLPHRDLYPNIGTEGANPDHKHDFVPERHRGCAHGAGLRHFDVLVNEVRDEGNEYSFLLVMRKRGPSSRGPCAYGCPKPEKTVCVVRYGGFGDMIQTAAILPALKREGFHVTVMTTPKGQDILRDDPHVDAWFIQDDDQVPNTWLGDFWRAQAKRFDRFVNLSESIEGTLLAIPGRANHSWPEATRRRLMSGVNYAEWTAELAGVEFAPDGKFYPSIDEAAQTQRYLAHVKERVAHAPRHEPRNSAQQIMGLAPTFRKAPSSVPVIQPVFNVMWCLAGSSVHKFYPHQDAVMAKILLEMPARRSTWWATWPARSWRPAGRTSRACSASPAR